MSIVSIIHTYLHGFGPNVKLLQNLKELIRILKHINWILSLHLLNQMRRNISHQVLHHILAHLVGFNLSQNSIELNLKLGKLINDFLLVNNGLTITSHLLHLLLLYGLIEQFFVLVNFLSHFVAVSLQILNHHLKLDLSVQTVVLSGLSLFLSVLLVAHFIDYKLNEF